MGYRGEDASRTRAAWGRQSPWQAPPGTGAADAGAWGDGSRDNGYGAASAGYPADEDHGYQADGGDGYPRYGGDGYSRYGDGSGGYERRDQYGYQDAGERPAGYSQADYGQSGYYQPGYGEPGYGQQMAPDYGTADGYGQPQPGGSPSRGGSGGYPALQPDSGGYPALPPDSGGYPALPPGSGRYTEQDAGNDWYGGQPAAASGASFADTGTYTLNGSVIEEYGSGPRRVLRDPVRGYPPAGGSGPHPVSQPGQRESYDDYFAGQERYGTPAGYDAPPGYDSRGYDDYAGFADDQHGYGAEPRGGVLDAYDQDPAADDPYENRYGEPPTRRGSRRKGRAAKSDDAAGRGGASRPRRKRPLLLTALSVVGVVIVGAAAYVYVVKPSHSANPSAQVAGLPTAGAQPSAQKCVQQYGTYCHIESRTLDPAPLTLSELYQPQITNVVNGKVTDSFSLAVTKLNTNCSDAVIGSDLTTELQQGKCTQVLRASYVSGDGKIMGTIGVINLATTAEAHHAGRVVGENDFIAPLAAPKGVASKLGQGTGVVEAEYKGHYLILTWSEFTNGTTPSTTAQDNALEQFSNDLVAGTVNISLSERMVTGAPATPAASAPASSAPTASTTAGSTPTGSASS